MTQTIDKRDQLGVDEKTDLTRFASRIRGLSIDAIDQANSGHPGLPLGCAELGAYLFGKSLSLNPSNPDWVNRDRFILSAGHGSMLLYASLYLSGFDYSLEDIKQFRQLGGCMPGHPEVEEVGVETTTGPLGQGIGHGVGMALAQKHVSARLNARSILDSQVVVLAGDGCMMEGVSSECSSFAGHMGLDNLILIYDANDICLDGPIDECFTENVALRYQSYGWSVQTIDGHDLDQIHMAYSQALAHTGQPSLIIAKTVIGKGSPNRQGTSEAHGKALGAEESALTKEALGIPLEPLFYVSEEDSRYRSLLKAKGEERESEWQQRLDDWKSDNPSQYEAFLRDQKQQFDADFIKGLKGLSIKENIATRSSSGAVLQYLHDQLPFVCGGSADLSCSDNTMMKSSGIISKEGYDARNIKFGVREFGMGAMAAGMALYGFSVPFCGTFLTFSDYMRNAIRLAALMQLNVIYQFTHDSVFLGEDGPTHQPVEHLASLRAMPGLTVIRPADETEVKGAWAVALTCSGPVALILSRLGVQSLTSTDFDGVSKGAYIVSKESQASIDYCLCASGAEVGLAVDVAAQLREKGHSVRVVSFPSFELFNQQSESYKASVLGEQVGQYWVIEAQVGFGWHQYVGRDAGFVTIETFGKSAPSSDLAKDFGFTVDQIVGGILRQAL